MLDAVTSQVVMRLLVAAPGLGSVLGRRRPSKHRLIALAMFALLACAKSDPIAPSGAGGLGGFEGRGGSSGNEAGPEGVGGFGGDSSGNASPEASGSGGFDGDEQSSAATGTPEACGDGLCDTPVETCGTCIPDCGACEEEPCGDGTCDGTQGETCDTCTADCGACAECGDGICEEPDEDCELCEEDCGVCACEPDDLEPNNSSPAASPLTVGVTVDDLSICAGDVDWLSFTVNGTRTITINFAQADGDLDLEIFSAASAQYITGSYSANDDEQVVLSGQPAGTYWARVYGDSAGVENRDYAIVVD